ncbi:hypothetical protein SK128_000273 [Halocaridina rubra]|uniref:Uncharacterized protein n=1 Tax=Halocaridina rubra TaxID=373956 RepID=A0AAN8X7N7_HALRR
MCRLQIEEVSAIDIPLTVALNVLLDQDDDESQEEEERHPHDSLHEFPLPYIHPPDFGLNYSAIEEAAAAINDNKQANDWLVSTDLPPPTPVYRITTFELGNGGCKFWASTKIRTFEPIGSVVPRSNNCFAVYLQFIIDIDYEFELNEVYHTQSGWVPHHLHIFDVWEIPTSIFPNSLTCSLQRLTDTHGWWYTPYNLTGFYCRYKICCPQQCIVTIQQLGPSKCLRSRCKYDKTCLCPSQNE